MPPFSPVMEKELRSFIPAGGDIIKNPIDAIPIFRYIEIFQRMIGLVSSQPQIDMLIISLSLDWLYGVDKGRQIQKVTDYLSGPVGDDLHGKPFIVSWRSYRNNPAIRKVMDPLEKQLLEAGVPVYRGFEQASMTLARWARYHQFLHARALR
ncbi:MAG: hypothetical protein JRE40_04080 [Deltaproteobacteria bacterium]|nr:hypothetical protein [Deltaproteobacteria bacterium]